MYLVGEVALGIVLEQGVIAVGVLHFAGGIDSAVAGIVRSLRAFLIMIMTKKFSSTLIDSAKSNVSCPRQHSCQ